MSIYASSLLLMAGARGKTLQELQRVLRIPERLRNDTIHKSFGLMMSKYFKPSSEMELNMANRLFLFRATDLLPEYTELVGMCYKASAELLNTLPNVEAKRNYINAWVASSTKDRIKDFLPIGSVDKNTTLSVINALYFKGLWENPFEKDFTHEHNFYCLNGEVMRITMMLKCSYFHVATLSDLDCMGVRLPFRKESLHRKWDMVILLPNENDGLPKLLSRLCAPQQLLSVLTRLGNRNQKRKTHLHLPKFNLTNEKALDLKQTLKECGVHQLFTKEADLSKLTDSEHLHVSEASHKVTLEVTDGAGTAAPRPYFELEQSPRCEPIKIRIDHPFFIALVCDSTVPMLIGHIARPVFT